MTLLIAKCLKLKIIETAANAWDVKAQFILVFSFIPPYLSHIFKFLMSEHPCDDPHVVYYLIRIERVIYQLLNYLKHLNTFNKKNVDKNIFILFNIISKEKYFLQN